MELKVQHPSPAHGLGNGKLLSLSRVINPGVQQSNNMAYNSADVSLRDKTRLLQLAERIQIKKTPSSYYTSMSGKQSSQSTPREKTRDLEQINSEMNRRSCLTNGTSHLEKEPTASVTNGNSAMFPTPSRPPSSLKKTFTRSKLYSSFSPSKKSSRLLKSDPAKTNIEHLVNFRNERKSESSPSPTLSNGTNNNEFPMNPASFHDKAKLASAFSPQQQPATVTTNERNSKLKSSRTKYGLGRSARVPSVGDAEQDSYTLMSTKERSGSAHHLLSEDFQDEADDEESSGAAEARMLTLPKISSANIIALNKKTGLSSADTNDGSYFIPQPRTRHKFPKNETEAITESTESGKNHKNKNTHSNDGVSDPTGFFSSLLAPNSGYDRALNGHSPSLGSLIPNNYENCGSSDRNKVLCSSEECPCEGVGKVLTGCTNPFLSSTRVESSCGGSLLDGPGSQKNDGGLCVTEDHSDREKEINDGDRTNEPLGSNGPATTEEDEVDRKKSSSLPKAFLSMENGTKNPNLPPG